MVKRILLGCLATLLLLPTTPVMAEDATSVDTPPHLVIVVLQTAQPGAGGNDFIEVYNPTAEPVDVTGWKLQYRAAAATGADTWATKRAVACAEPLAECAVVVPPAERLVFSTYQIDGMQTQPLSSGFSDVGGQVRLVRPSTGSPELIVEDMLGYGTAAEAEAQAAAAPPAGQVLLRNANDQGVFSDTGNNATDFTISCYESPQPVTCPEPPAPPADENQDDLLPPAADPGTTSPPPTDPGETAGGSPIYLPLNITELLPDPASPQLDSSDEFIELYNPNAAAVDLNGYRLEAGTDFKYHYTLTEGTITPGSYSAVLSAESNIPLTNSGTSVRLLDPNGEVVAVVTDYGQAKAGQAWAQVAGDWQWTTQPTPGAANVLAVPPAKAVAAASTAAKAVSTKKAATPKVATTKTASTKAAAKTTADATPTPPTDQAQGDGLTYALLIPIGLLAVGYIVYEYRQNIARACRKMWGAVTGQNKAKADEPTLQTD